MSELDRWKSLLAASVISRREFIGPGGSSRRIERRSFRDADAS